MRSTLLVLILATLGVARAQEARDLEASLVHLAERARERTVLIYGVIGLGSGAIVDPSGVVVTNAHVVAGARYAMVQWPDGTTGLARQRGIDYTRDLAVLEPVEPQPRRLAFTLAPAVPAEGTWVVALGYPGGLQTTGSPTVSLGRVLGRAAPRRADLLGQQRRTARRPRGAARGDQRRGRPRARR
jgi:S1-C subfamily serine protease